MKVRFIKPKDILSLFCVYANTQRGDFFMSKSKQTYKPKPFESANGYYEHPTTGKIQTDTSANIYEGMLLNPLYQNLLPRQHDLYTVCKAQYYGKRKPRRDYPEIEEFQSDECFYLNWGLVQRYGIYSPSMQADFREDMKALIDHGFIDIVASGKAHRTKTVYRFSDRWWAKPITVDKRPRSAEERMRIKNGEVLTVTNRP